MTDSIGTTIGSTSPSLLARLKAHDQEGWRRLRQLYGGLVLYWLRQAGIARNDREDVFQNVFCDVASHIDKFQRERTGSFRAWLRSIVHSKVVDHHRRGGQNATGGTKAHRQLLEIPAEQEVSASTASPDANERVLVLRQALAIVQPEFEPKTWEAAHRTLIDGRLAPEVAEELGMTPAAVRKAKSRVLRRLRTEMEGLLD